MAGKGTEFEQFLAGEVERYKGVTVPVRVPFICRKIIKRVPLSRLHPNPDDEFCFPDIGPNMGIISNYEKDYHRFGSSRTDAAMAHSGIAEPIQIQKILPDGYMILNGHHRWAAAKRAGIKTLPVKIVNVTQTEDIRKLLSGVRNSKRVALDLDEVVFASEDEPAEPPLRFPWRRLYPQSIRLGIPSLFWYLGQHGYDVWVYTSQLVSDDEIMHLLKHHHAGAVCVVTGTGRNGRHSQHSDASVEKMIFEKYPFTFHIDQKSVLKISSATHEFEEFPLPGNAGWSGEVQDIFRKLDRNV